MEPYWNSVRTVNSPGLLISWAQVDSSHPALSFNTLAFEDVTQFLRPCGGYWVLTGILTIIYLFFGKNK
jgi:hypothetical protein